MYIAVVVLTMLVLPVGSILVDLSLGNNLVFMVLVGKWFVFWSVGIRLMLAGLRQWTNPGFTAREIFHIDTGEVLPLIKELGVSNISIGIVGILSIYATSFTVPVAIYATFFYCSAGIGHFRERNRSGNETMAMVSDLFIAAVLACFVAWVVTAPS